MRKSRLIWESCLVATLLLMSSFAASAHKPIAILEVHPDDEHALVVRDIDISQVAYVELTPEAPQFWLAFETQGEVPLPLSLGVPVIDRLNTFRPALLVLGPGLPETTLPFPIPAGMGGEVYPSDGVFDPHVFYEPFTGTNSWVLEQISVPLSAPGRYYVVGYSPSHGYGKLWIAIGEKEAFGLSDFVRLPSIIGEVRSFHEVGGPPRWVVPVLVAAVLLGFGVWWVLQL